MPIVYAPTTPILPSVDGRPAGSTTAAVTPISSPAALAVVGAPAPALAVPARAVPETAEARDRRETLTLAKLTGAGVIIVLIVFLTMMAVLGSYGPGTV